MLDHPIRQIAILGIQNASLRPPETTVWAFLANTWKDHPNHDVVIKGVIPQGNHRNPPLRKIIPLLQDTYNLSQRSNPSGPFL